MLGLLIGYMFLFVHRPFEVWPALGTLRIELIYMLVTGAVWLAAPSKRFVSHPLHLALAAFAGAVLVCSMVSPWSDQSLEAMGPYFKFLVYYLMLVTVIQDADGLRKVTIGFIAFMGLYMLHSLWEYHCGRYVSRMGISRMIGVDATRNDPNAFAASILLALVFVPTLWRTEPSKRLKFGLAGFVALSMLCIALTGSRGGFVGVIIWGAATIWSSPWRKRLMVLALPAAPVLFLCMPESLQNRFYTIVDPSVGPANAKASSDARIDGFLIGMQLWADNPATGIGPDAWLLATKRRLKAHNLYGQLAGEMGTLGVLTFSAMIGTFLFTFYRLRRAYRQHPEWGHDFLYHVTGSVALGVFLLLFEGNFGHNLYRYNWALYIGMLSIAALIVQRRATEAASEWNATTNDEEAAETHCMPGYGNYA